jgi:alpha,alpha-trehalase
VSDKPIGDYAVLSDRHSAALISRDGSVDWLCFPRFDSPSVFARLLGDQAGFWSLKVGGVISITRRYVERSMVLETTYTTPAGTAVIVDALAVGDGNRGHELGHGSPHLLLRQARCTGGQVEMECEYVPRPAYGLEIPVIVPVEGGVVTSIGPDVLALSGPIPLSAGRSSVSFHFRLAEGEQVGFALQYTTAAAPNSGRIWTDDEIAARLDDTVSAWQSWSELHQAYVGPWSELVHHSGRVLQALSFQPTGAICAAATTSLPESIGGERNWDYRYTWIRDASFTIEALWVAACPDEANVFFDYITESATSSLKESGDLQIMFGIAKESDLNERTLTHLPGWRNSSPVRVGNAAWRQRQLDVYGELLGAVYRLSDRLFDSAERRVGPLAASGQWDTPPEVSRATRLFLVELADTAARRWKEKDSGIWEVRGEPRHFVYSKLMCWVALQRATSLADLLGAPERVESWASTQAQIADAILSEGWSDRLGAFTQCFGSDDLDASNLMMPLVGFLPADDSRVVATIQAAEEHLTDAGGLVLRYRSADGLAGNEGAFLLCTFWLAQALAMSGRVEDASKVFERTLPFVNDVGLLGEEVDVTTGELLGNFPQALSHIGLVNAAWAISTATKSGPGGKGRSGIGSGVTVPKVVRPHTPRAGAN